MAIVLIVEDEFAITALLEIVLTDDGHQVLTASNGRQGLQRLATGPRPDLIISDYMMPILDGPSLIQTLQQSETQRAIPYILMSAMPEACVRERIDGYAAYVQKPFRLAALVKVVAAVLGAPLITRRVDVDSAKPLHGSR
jgi:CheY-like chemotaxis protein